MIHVMLVPFVLFNIAGQSSMIMIWLSASITSKSEIRQEKSKQSGLQTKGMMWNRY
jgi:hypothetical protein